jgi:hypothetical protein
MGESLLVTIVYEPGEDGSIVASIPEVHAHMATGARARRRGANVIEERPRRRTRRERA